MRECWAEEIVGGKTDYKLKNAKCDRDYESCANVRHVTGGPFYVCLLSSYCDQSFASHGLVWGTTRNAIKGTISCPEGKKPDPKAALATKAAEVRQATKEKDASAMKGMIVGKGMKCKTAGKDLGFMKTAKLCSAKAQLEKDSCNFFMYSTDYPVEGCKCCDKYEPVADTGATGKQYDIFKTCVDLPATDADYAKK